MSGEEKVEKAKTESAEGNARPAHARYLRWGNTEDVREIMQDLETGHFDIVLGSDLIYPEDVRVPVSPVSIMCLRLFFRGTCIWFL